MSGYGPDELLCHHAADEAALDALWQTYRADWDDDATRMVHARLAELRAT